MKKLTALVLLLILCGTAFADSFYKRAESAKRYSTGGQVLVSSSAQVWVYLAGTTTQATVYSNSTGSVLAQPVVADIYGNYSYYAAAGFYDESVVGPAGTLPVSVYSILVGAPLFPAVPLSSITSTPTITGQVSVSGGHVYISSGVTSTLNWLRVDN